MGASGAAQRSTLCGARACGAFLAVWRAPRCCRLARGEGSLRPSGAHSTWVRGLGSPLARELRAHSLARARTGGAGGAP